MNAGALWLLVLVANAAPLAATRLGRRPGPAIPIDFDLKLLDGRPLFGAHKSWRGLALSVIGTGIAAWLLGLPSGIGVEIACWAMIGDLSASFAKRRLAIDPGGMALGLDQLPESLLPLIVLGRPHLSWPTIAGLAVAFMAADIALRLAHSLLRR